MSIRVVLCGDSRVEGYGDKQDFPITPGPATTYGTAYSSTAGVVATVTPQAGAPGTGFTCGVKRIASSGKLALYIQSRGSGYVANQMPSVSVSGGDGTPPDFSTNVLPAGGYAVRVENYLIANGFPGAVVINHGLDGQTAAGWAKSTGLDSNYNQTMAEGAAGNSVNALIYVDVGFNDINSGSTAQAYHDNLLAAVNFWVADGYAVMLSYPFGCGTAGTTSQKANNAIVQSLSTQIDSIIATNPARVFKGVDNYSLFAANDSFFSGDGVHQLASGDVGIAAQLGPRMAQVMTALTVPPVAPASLSAAAPQASAVLSWPASTGATGYKIRRDGVTTPIYTGPLLTFTDAFALGTSHTYTVTAYNAAGESAATTAITASAITASLSLVVTQGGGATTLTWTADPLAVNGYAVLWIPGSALPTVGGIGEIVARIATGTLTWADTSVYRVALAAGCRYEIISLR